MKHSHLIALLEKYLIRWPNERDMVERIEALIRTHTDCCERTCVVGHLTGSAWIVSHDGSRHLLLHHKKLDKWLQPGGHADGEADLAAVALREAVEESGLSSLAIDQSYAPAGLLDVDVHDIPARYAADGSLKEPRHEHHDLRFLVRCAQAIDPVLSEESNAVRWCTPDEVRELTQEASVLRLLDKAMEHLAQV